MLSEAQLPSEAQMLSEAAMRTQLRCLIRRLAKDVPMTDQTPLFSQRVLRSIHLPELIILLERLRGKPIDIENLQPGDFDSIDVMVERFGVAS